MISVLACVPAPPTNPISKPYDVGRTIRYSQKPDSGCSCARRARADANPLDHPPPTVGRGAPRWRRNRVYTGKSTKNLEMKYEGFLIVGCCSSFMGCVTDGR
jgi:hypothetical protein